MTENYKKLLKKGEEFQDFLIGKMAQYGIIIMQYSSRKYQYDAGESFSRHEIKFDDRMAETGNLYIEVAEKTNSANLNWVNSGIDRKDNTIFFIIGNYDKVFMFSKKILRAILDKNTKHFRLVETSTSRGYLIPIVEAEKYADVIDFKTNKIN